MAEKKTKEELTAAAEKLKQMQDGRIRQVLKEMPELNPSTLSFLATNAEAELESRAGEQAESAELLRLSDIKEEILEAERTSGKVSGLFTGLDLLDELIGGLKPSETTLIAGASNNGKSFLAAYMASQVAQQTPTLFITLEMQPATLGARIKKMIPDDEFDNLDLYFQKTFRLDYRTIEPMIKNAYNNGIRCVFIDYLQYLGVGMKPEEVAKISRMLSELTLTYNIPFVIVVSVRKTDNKSEKKWALTDLEDIMGTSAIGYDADNVVVVSRKNPDNEYDSDGMWIKHIKARNMPVHYGTGQFVRFQFLNGAIVNDEKFNEEYTSEFLTKVNVKKIEQPAATQMPMDVKNLTKFERRKLGLPDAEELSEEELNELQTVEIGKK